MSHSPLAGLEQPDPQTAILESTLHDFIPNPNPNPTADKSDEAPTSTSPSPSADSGHISTPNSAASNAEIFTVPPEDVVHLPCERYTGSLPLESTSGANAADSNARPLTGTLAGSSTDSPAPSLPSMESTSTARCSSSACSFSHTSSPSNSLMSTSGVTSPPLSSHSPCFIPSSAPAASASSFVASARSPSSSATPDRDSQSSPTSSSSTSSFSSRHSTHMHSQYNPLHSHFAYPQPQPHSQTHHHPMPMLMPMQFVPMPAPMPNRAHYGGHHLTHSAPLYHMHPHAHVPTPFVTGPSPGQVFHGALLVTFMSTFSSAATDNNPLLLPVLLLVERAAYRIRWPVCPLLIQSTSFLPPF